MSLFEAYLFDLDGTLVDSAPDLHATLNVILREEGCAPVTLEAVRAFIGEGARRLLERSLEAQGDLRSRRALTGSSSAISLLWQPHTDHRGLPRRPRNAPVASGRGGGARGGHQ